MSPYFGGLITFVKQTEPLINMEGAKIPVDAGVFVSWRRCADHGHSGRINGLIKGFSQDWKRAIDEIDSEVMRSFTNFKNGTVVLQQVKCCV